MLSILIPIYNQEVVALVDTLQKQCTKAKITYEILCYDDGSTQEFKNKNAVVAGYFGVNYTELSQNLGRSKIRNWLAKTASYENLLYLDCDSKLVGRKFIQNYLKHLDTAKVISGGRIYSKKPPRAKSKKLHWLYGKLRESKPAAYRNKHPLLYFHSNNFIIKRDLMLAIQFDENIKGYGYEDLLLAKALRKKDINILHVDNPVQHLGLEKSKVFLSKTENAIDNLLWMKYKDKWIKTRLESSANKLQDWGFHEDFLRYYKKREKKIIKNLTSDTPKIRNFDFFKLHYYLEKRNEWIEGTV